jgi:FkbM family methyltransferase
MLKRLAPTIRKRIAYLTWPNGRGIVRRDGVPYLLNLQSQNWYDKQILYWKAPESEQRAFLVENIRRRDCDTFLDIGANFGMYAACVALQTDCTTIIAYKPDKRSYDRLRANLLINGLTEKVQTRMGAVSDHSGTVPFKLGPVNDASVSEVGEDGSGYSVPSVRLDDELPLKAHRIAFKIDIQFHELTALQGMTSLLRENECFLQVECVENYAAPFIAAMQAEGYKLLYRIDIDYYFARG